MKQLVLLIITILMLPFVVSAESGFTDGGVWLGKEPAFAGDEVRVYAAISNTDADELIGVIVFYDGDAEIGRESVSIPAHQSALVSTTWSAEEGDHAFSAGFESDDEQAPIERRSTSVFSTFVDTDTDGDGVGNRDDADDDNDGIADGDDEYPLVHKNKELLHSATEAADKAVDAVRPVIEEQAPKVIEATKKVVERVEEFREDKAQALADKRDEYKEEIAAATATGTDAAAGDAGAGEVLLKRAQLAAVSAAAVVFDYAVLFYFAALALLYFIGSRFVRFMRRRTGADRLPA